MKLVFATNNQHKISEITSLLSNKIDILSLRDIKCFHDLEESGDTLISNALQKARFIYDTYNIDCFADDTGLEIISLDGAPGVYSARYAGPLCIAEDNIKKVLSELSSNKDRSAVFRTIIALILNGEEIIFEGVCYGVITKRKQGVNGFGYDSIFMPTDYNLTFAQMTLKEKSVISHRGMAVKKLASFLSQYFL